MSSELGVAAWARARLPLDEERLRRPCRHAPSAESPSLCSLNCALSLSSFCCGDSGRGSSVAAGGGGLRATSMRAVCSSVCSVCTCDCSTSSLRASTASASVVGVDLIGLRIRSALLCGGVLGFAADSALTSRAGLAGSGENLRGWLLSELLTTDTANGIAAGGGLEGAAGGVGGGERDGEAALAGVRSAASGCSSSSLCLSQASVSSSSLAVRDGGGRPSGREAGCLDRGCGSGSGSGWGCGVVGTGLLSSSGPVGGERRRSLCSRCLRRRSATAFCRSFLPATVGCLYRSFSRLCSSAAISSACSFSASSRAFSRSVSRPCAYSLSAALVPPRDGVADRALRDLARFSRAFSFSCLAATLPYSRCIVAGSKSLDERRFRLRARLCCSFSDRCFAAGWWYSRAQDSESDPLYSARGVDEARDEARGAVRGAERVRFPPLRRGLRFADALVRCRRRLGELPAAVLPALSAVIALCCATATAVGRGGDGAASRGGSGGEGGR